MCQVSTRRERKKLQTRQAILDAAAELFESQGFRATTVAQIAERADVAPRTFFLHFGAKEDLLFSHLDDFIATAAATIRDSAQLPEALVEAVGVMVARYDEIAQFAKERARLVGPEESLPPAVMNRLWAAQDELLEMARRTFPDSYDAVETPALLGALLGAVVAAAQAAVADRLPAQQVRVQLSVALRRAAAGFLT